MVRIAAAICALVFALLFGWVAIGTFIYPEPMVTPSKGVIGSVDLDPLPTGPQARNALADRTRLQDWRAESGPSPGGAVTTGQASSGEQMPTAKVRDRGQVDLPQEWLARRDEDWPLLIDRGYTVGIASLPSERDAVLMQPQGRDFRRQHEGLIPYAGGWIIFGMSLALSLFLLIRGRIPLVTGFSGERIERFNGLERMNHWMTAASFVVLSLTGLILIYGWAVFAPLLGPGGYSVVAQASMYLHIAFAAPFIVGVLVMAIVWTRQNLPSRLDLHWLARFGGFLNNSPEKPPARRFNAGQKLVFWGVFIGGILMTISGVTLMFPFYWTGVITLEWVLIGHALLALLMVGLILGHIYIGTVGMVGAFDAMWSGRVDRNWAEEHHELWIEEKQKHQDVPPRQWPMPAE